MRRFSIGLLATAILLGGHWLAISLIAQAQITFAPTIDPTKPLTSTRISAAACGVTSNVADADRNSRIFDQINNQIVVSPNSTAILTRKTIQFDGPTTFKFPCWLEGNKVRVEGTGVDDTSITGVASYPTFIVGLARNPAGHTLTQANFVDLTPQTVPPTPWIVNPAIATGPDGHAYGLKLGSTTTLTGPGTSGAHGPPGGYSSLKQFHIAFFVNFGPTTRDEPLFGVSQINAAAPWQIHRYADNLTFHVTTADGVFRSAKIMTPAVVGPFKGDIQIDWPNGTVNAWANDTEVTVNTAGMGTDFKPGNSLRFIDNDFVPLRIGGEGIGLECSDYWGTCSDYSGNALPNTVYPDLTLYALTLHSARRYVNAGVGTPKQRLDGTVETDYSRWYDMNAKDMFWSYWPGFSPADVIQWRIVPFNSYGQAGQCLLWLDPLAADPNFSSAGNSISKMTIGTVGTHGMTILLGHALHAQFTDLTVNGGWNAIGTTNLGANYPILVRDCTLGGNDAAFNGFFGIYTLDRVYVNLSGRTAFRFAGSSVLMNDCMVAGNGAPDYIVRIHPAQAGGDYLINRLIHDFEGGYPKKAVIRLDGHTWNPGGRTNLTINNASGLIPAGAVGVDLVSMGPVVANSHAGGTFSYQGLNLYSLTGDAAIRADSPFWQVVGAREGSEPWVVGTGRLAIPVPTTTGPTGPIAPTFLPQSIKPAEPPKRIPGGPVRRAA